VEAGHEAALREMAEDWPFFRIFLDDLAMVLSKGDLSIAELFSHLAGERLHGRVFPLKHELELTKHWVSRSPGMPSRFCSTIRGCASRSACAARTSTR
jgi:phosphoenolpyruvate carboxylase